jgi:hypothetical protein
MPDDRLLDGIRVSGELVADRRPDEVGAIGVEALVHQQIDMAKVDESDVVIFSFSPDLSRSRCISPIIAASCHPYGWYMDRRLQ